MVVSLCQVSREFLVAMGFITHCSESCEDSINIYSWIYCSPGHNCKVENFFFSCVLSLTETCLPNVGMALCSFLHLCPFYSWCRESLQQQLQTTLLLFFFFFLDKEISKLTCFSIEQGIFLLHCLILLLSFLNSFVQGKRLQYGYLIWFFLGGGILKYF